MVDVDVRPDCWPGSCRGGVGSGASSRTCVNEPIVDDLPRLPSRMGGAKPGDDLADRADVVESVRSNGLPGAASFKDVIASAECDGDGSGDGSPYSV